MPIKAKTKNKTKNAVTFTLDGKSVEAPTGATILEAAGHNGVHIPTLCYHPKLKPMSSCRVCSVEVEGVDAPVMSCVTPAVDGMNVTSKSPALDKFRADMIRFILVNHPLDCPVCERSGECLLQDSTYDFGITGHEWKTDGHIKEPVVDWGLIRYDVNLCIMCERCVSICREVQGITAYKIDGSGNGARINTVTGKPLDCDFCGQCIAVCPVGALASGIIFTGRSWEVEKFETICPHCGVGCSYNLDVKKGMVARVTSDESIGHNNGNLCSRGRFGYEFIQSSERILTPLVKEGSRYVKTDWDTTLALVARKLAGIKMNHGGSSIIGIGSEVSTNEDAYLMQKFFREVLGSANIDNMSNILAPEFCSRLFENFDGVNCVSSFDELSNGDIFVYIGFDGSNENPVMSNHVRKAIMDNGAEVAVAFSKKAFFLPPPKVRLVYDYPKLYKFVIALLKEILGSTPDSPDLPESVNSIEIDAEWRHNFENACGGIVKEIGPDLGSGIADLAAAIKKKSKPFYIIGQEVQRHPQAAAITVQIANLAKLTGGRIVVLREYCNTQGVNDMGVASGALPGYKKDGAAKRNEGRNAIDILLGGMAKAMVVMEEDVLARHPERATIKDAMGELDFTVVIDSFFTDTCEEADVILPACVAAEKTGTFTNVEGRVQSLNPAVERVGVSRSPWEIFTELENNMGNEFSYGSSDEVFGEIAGSVQPYGNALATAFADYGGLAGGSPVLTWAEPEPIIKPVEDALMALPDRSLFALGVNIKHCPSLRRLDPASYAAFGPADAKKFGISEDDDVEFSDARGKWKAAVRIDEGVATGTVRIPQEMESATLNKITVNGKALDCVTPSGLGKGR
ncbi:MAG: molybdopterin-dependent oxidoreductase [Nitrospinota bacterium]